MTTNNEKCLLCGYSKHVQRCHFIPRRFTQKIEGYQKYTDYENENIIPLCPTHHWELDHNLLDDSDYEKVVNVCINRSESFRKDFEYLVCAKIVSKENVEYSFRAQRNILKATDWILFNRNKLDVIGMLKDKYE
jgi:predicted restriction endonuclease